MADNRIRINLLVEPDVPEILARLAGSQRRIGEWLSTTVRSIELEDQTIQEIQQADAQALRFMVQGLAGRLRAAEGELVRVSSTLATMITQRAPLIE